MDMHSDPKQALRMLNHAKRYKIDAESYTQMSDGAREMREWALKEAAKAIGLGIDPLQDAEGLERDIWRSLEFIDAVKKSRDDKR